VRFGSVPGTRSFEHAVRLCAIPLVLYNIIECCNVKCVRCVYSEKDQQNAHFS
jgi:hypothetical protein